MRETTQRLWRRHPRNQGYGRFFSSPARADAAIQILLVEDDPACARRLARVMTHIHAQVEVAIASSLAKARALLRQRSYGWALVDMHLPDGSGLTLLQELARDHPATEAVVISAWGHTDSVINAIRAGARGYLLKNADDEDLIRSLGTLRGGGAPIDPLVAARILALLAGPAVSRSDATNATRPAPVSIRELEVLQHVAAGHTNREIAQMLDLSVYTVECHTRSIYRKLAVRSRTEAVTQAQTHGWL